MKNPYEILGVPSSASDAEIKQAYREKARQYSDGHDSAQTESAAKKMQELDDAYDTIIMTRRSTGSNYQQSQQYSQRQSTGPYRQQTQNRQSEFHDIRQTIKRGRIEDAQVLLDGIPQSGRTAEWYFLKGTIHQRRGWLEEALQCYRTAAHMEPENVEYQSALRALENSRNGGYRTNSRGNSEGKGCSACDICAGLMCADCLCDCFGGNCC